MQFREIKERIRKELTDAGASAVGFASAEEVSEEAVRENALWLDSGMHGEMGYLLRHKSLKLNTENVLPGTQTVITLAFNYNPGEWPVSDNPVVAAYAFGEDYHDALRRVLKKKVEGFRRDYGGKWRICIDSAPLAERYWAVKSGIAKRSINGNVIVESCGSFCFLAEILTDLKLSPDTATEGWCMRCGKCVSLCPGKAINGDGTIDARKCINYLTIEKEGEFNPEEKEIVNKARGHLYGCDICLRVCPHNKDVQKSSHPFFSLTPQIRNLTPLDLMTLTEEEFKEKFKTSPLLYAGFSKLLRNAGAIMGKAADPQNPE